MAKVILGTTRPQASNSGLFKQTLQSGQVVIVRRKLFSPNDSLHPSSRATAAQRARFTRASQNYSRLPRTTKQRLKLEYANVNYQPPHGRTDTKLLYGKSLAISQDIHSLATVGTVMSRPTDLCVISQDAAGDGLEVRVLYLVAGLLTSKRWDPEHLGEANYLFTAVETYHDRYALPYDVTGWLHHGYNYPNWPTLLAHRTMTAHPYFWFNQGPGGQQPTWSYDPNWSYYYGHRRQDGLVYRVTPLPPLDGDPYNIQPPFTIIIKETQIREFTVDLKADNYLPSPRPGQSPPEVQSMFGFWSIPDYGPKNCWFFFRLHDVEGNPWVYYPSTTTVVIGF